MKRTVSIITIALITVIFGCASHMKSFKSNSNGWKPNDFVPSEGVLLIERVTWPKHQQKKIEDFMTKEYPYKYEFVDTKDLTNSIEKFADKNIFRFALVSTYSTHNVHQNDLYKQPLNIETFDFNFVDRLNNKEYPKSGIASSWASMTFKKIIETLLAK